MSRPKTLRPAPSIALKIGALVVILSNIADLLKAIKSTSENLYGLLIFQWHGARYLPWILGVVGYATIGWAIYALLAARRPDWRQARLVTAALVPALVLFIGNAVLAGGFGTRPVDVWNRPLERAETRLRAARVQTGGYRFDPANYGADTQAWATAQVLVAELNSAMHTRSLSQSDIEATSEFLERARLPDGWSYFGNILWPVTEVTAWVNLANATLARSPAAGSETKKKVIPRITRDVLSLLLRQDRSGGWKPLDETATTAQSTPCQAAGGQGLLSVGAGNWELSRTYSTIMSLWSLAESLEFLSLPDRAKATDAIRAGTNWLLKNIGDKGWTPNPSRRDPREAYAGLTAQALFVLERLNEIDATLVQQPEAYKSAKRVFLGLPDLSRNAIAHNSRMADIDVYLFPTSYVLEGSTFLWFPWSFAVVTQLERDASLLAEDRQKAHKIAQRLVSLVDDETKNVEDALTYELAESLIGIRAAMMNQVQPVL